MKKNALKSPMATMAILSIGALGLAAAAWPSMASARRCMMFLPETSYDQSVAPNGKALVHQWQANCSGVMMMSGGGMFRLEKFAGGEWQRLSRGLSVNATLDPGTYRIWVENITHTPARFRIRWRMSAG